MHIYIAKNGTQTGPFTEDQLKEMLGNGLISPGDLAWHDGVTDWQPLHLLLGSGQPSSHPISPMLASGLTPTTTSVQSAGPTGIGGWLTFFCVSLTILSPLFALASIGKTWTQSEALFVRFPTIKTVLIWENLGSIVLVIYGFIVGCIIWSGNPQGRRIARRFLVIRLVGFICVEIVALFMISSLPSEMVAGGVGGVIGAIFQSVVYFVIWWFYFKQSKRVRNTYGDETADRLQIVNAPPG